MRTVPPLEGEIRNQSLDLVHRLSRGPVKLSELPYPPDVTYQLIGREVVLGRVYLTGLLDGDTLIENIPEC